MSKTPFDLNSVSPQTDPKFSPNLFAWLKKNFKNRHETPEVFRNGVLYVGYMFDGDFIGSRLSTILCTGARTQVFSFGGGRNPKKTFRRIVSFWPKYRKLGRCAIDPTHGTIFTDERWKEGPRRRTCLWCGHVQKKVTKRRVVVETNWVAA